MLDGLFIASAIVTCIQYFKESFSKPIPIENWGNKELYYRDLVNGVSVKQRMKNLENGKYKLTKTISDSEPCAQPHKDPTTGKIIIENCLLYNEDLKKYGAVQTMKWVKEGKYNLTPEELEKERERIKANREHLYSLL